MTDKQSSPPETDSTDALFKRMIIVSTALSLVTAYGWLAGFERQPGGDFSFHWRWNILLWAFIGFISNAYFWRKVWPVAGRAAAMRKDIIKGSAALLLPGLWWITFPLRFLSGQHFWDVVIGLAAAATVLSFGAWMVIRLIKAFERSDLEDLKALDSAAAELAGKEPSSKK
ncbi:MAG: hypothetical protein ABSF34_00785 [Verrucomicrobiota bacterium]